MLAHAARRSNAAVARARAVVERPGARRAPRRAEGHRPRALPRTSQPPSARRGTRADVQWVRRHAVGRGAWRRRGGAAGRRPAQDLHAGHEPGRHRKPRRTSGVRRGSGNPGAGGSAPPLDRSRERRRPHRGFRLGPRDVKPAVLLLSGGLDSTTALAVARRDGFDVHAMSFRYGQRHVTEIESARRVANAFGLRDHTIVDIDLRAFGGSALTGDAPVPKDRQPLDRTRGIPATYVPARNTVFLSFALAWAEVLGADDIFIGVNALDYSGYPDCRPEYIEAFERMANLATKVAVEGRQRLSVHTPFIHLTKAQIIAR